MPKELKTLTFDWMKDFFRNADGTKEESFLLSHDLSVLVNVASAIRHVIRMGVLVQVSDYRFGFVSSGHARIRVNLIEYEVSPGFMAFLSPGTTVEPLEASHDFTLTGMVVSSELLRIALGGRLPAIFNGERMASGLCVDSGKHDVVKRLFRLLCDVLCTQKDQQVVLGLVATIIHEFNYLLEGGQEQRQARLTTQQLLFERFINLVNAHCVGEHHLRYYAGRMCLSEHYLSMVVRKASGTTAKEWIDRAIITQAKIRLMKSDRSVGSVSDELHFPNPSFFNKYFKRLTGKTPLQFRQER